MKFSPSPTYLFAGLALILLLPLETAFGQQLPRRGAPGSTPTQDLERFIGGPVNQDLSGPQSYAVSTDQDSCTDKRYCIGRVNSTPRDQKQSDVMKKIELYLGDRGASPSQGTDTLGE